MPLIDATFNEKDELIFEVPIGTPGGTPQAVSYDGDNVKVEVVPPEGGGYPRSRIVNT